MLAACLAGSMLAAETAPRAPGTATTSTGISPAEAGPPAGHATSAPAAQPVSPIGTPAYTWTLSNGTATPGLFLTQNGSTPDVIAIDSLTQTAWLGYIAALPSVEADVVVANLTTGSVVGDVPGTPNASLLLFVPQLNAMMVGESLAGDQGALAVLNASTGLPIHAPLPLQASPTGAAYDPYSGELLVAGPGADNVTFVSTATFEETNISLPISTVGGGGTGPQNVTYDPYNGDFYVLAESGYAYVYVLNGTTGATAAPAIPADPQPYSASVALAFDPVSRAVYMLVENYTNTRGESASTLSEIDPRTQAAVDVFETPLYDLVNSMTVDPASGQILLTGSAARGLSGISQDDGALVTFNVSTGDFVVPAGNLGPNPSLEAVDPTSGLDYVVHIDQTYLSIVDPSNASRTYPILGLGGSPAAGTYDPADRTTYFADRFVQDGPLDQGSLPNAVVGIAAGSAAPLVVLPIGGNGTSPADEPGGEAPWSVVYDPVGNQLFVSGSRSSELTVLNGSTGANETTIDLGSSASYLAVDPTTGEVVVSDTAGEIEAYAGGSDAIFAATSTTGYGCQLYPIDLESIAVDPQADLVFDLCSGTGAVLWNLTTNTTTYLAAPGSEWNAVAFDAADGDFYVADGDDGELWVVNATTASVEGDTATGASPDFVAYDASSGSVLVANYASNNLSVYDGGSFTTGEAPTVSLATGAGPGAITVAGPLNQTFVSNVAGGSITEYSTTPAIASFGATPGVLDANGSTAFAVDAHGGSGTLSYAYSSLPPGCASADEARLACDPSVAGNYEVTVRVTDAADVTASATTTVTVHPRPTLAISVDPTAVEIGGEVHVGATATGGTLPYSVAWSFGDGGTAAGPGAVHAYSGAGSYTVTATLSDGAGARIVSSENVTVAAALVASGSGGRIATSGNATAWIATAAGGIPPYEFAWSFGDGATLLTGAADVNGSLESSVTHRYAAAGTYTVSVTVRDALGAQAVWNSSITIPPVPVSTPVPAVPAPPWTLLGLAAADAALAGLAAALWLRRGRVSRGKDP
jgi:DNA-binding beta-propeller fold protein YncE/PKD repeat protein